VAMLRGAPGVHEVTRDPDGPIIVSVDDGAHAMPKIIGEIENAGAVVTSIKLERMSLEDVFIQFTGRRLRDEPAQGRFLQLEFRYASAARTLTETLR